MPKSWAILQRKTAKCLNKESNQYTFQNMHKKLTKI